MSDRYMRNRNGVVAPYNGELLAQPHLGLAECELDGSDLTPPTGLGALVDPDAEDKKAVPKDKKGAKNGGDGS